MKILVTGGAGFIGSNFLLYMIKQYPHYQFINVDSLTYAGNLSNLKEVEQHANYKFIKADICDKGLMERIFASGIDAVVNFAAESHVDRSIMMPSIFVETNVLGTQHLLDLSKQYNVSKYVQVSTDEVYGTLGDSGKFTEQTPLAPNSPYSASKAGADMLVRAYHETYGLDVNITRCSNNYGPYQFPEKLIPLMISHALQDKSLPIYGDGLQVRDWLYVEDHCSALDLVLHKGKSGEVYNIGGQNERTNLQVVHTILDALNKPKTLINFVEDRPGHDRRYAIDATKIIRELGWAPKYDYETGLRLTIKWYIEHVNWINSIVNGEYQDYYKWQYEHRLGGTN